jgi:hypothetical protein
MQLVLISTDSIFQSIKRSLSAIDGIRMMGPPNMSRASASARQYHSMASMWDTDIT